MDLVRIRSDDAHSFWMKNAPIPLDILFVKANGAIVRIAANATPLSEGFLRMNRCVPCLRFQADARPNSAWPYAIRCAIPSLRTSDSAPEGSTNVSY